MKPSMSACLNSLASGWSDHQDLSARFTSPVDSVRGSGAPILIQAARSANTASGSFGFEHDKLTFKRNGAALTLTNNQPARVVRELLA